MSTKSQKKFGDKETTLDVIKSLMFSNAQKNKTFYNIWMGVVFVHVVFQILLFTNYFVICTIKARIKYQEQY